MNPPLPICRHRTHQFRPRQRQILHRFEHHRPGPVFSGCGNLGEFLHDGREILHGTGRLERQRHPCGRRRHGGGIEHVDKGLVMAFRHLVQTLDQDSAVARKYGCQGILQRIHSRWREALRRETRRHQCGNFPFRQDMFPHQRRLDRLHVSALSR